MATPSTSATIPHPRGRSPLTVWLMLLLCAGAFAGAVVYLLRWGAEAGRGLPPFSVYSADVDGLAEAASVLRKLGWQPVALTRPVHHTREQGLLFVVEPSTPGPLGGRAPEMTAADVRGVLAWVGRGNTLVLASRVRTALHAALGVVPSRHDGDDTPRTVRQIEVSGYTDGVRRLEVEGQGSLAAPGNAVPLWWVSGQPGAVLVPHGAGRAIVLADPTILTHRGLLREDNVILLYNLVALEAREGRVLFDEYHHGIRAGGGYWGYLRYHNQHWAALQLLAVALVAGWAIGVRLGPARKTANEPAADAVDYASGVARIYLKAGAGSHIAGILVRDFHEGLAALLRVRRSATGPELMAAWRARYLDGESRAELGDLLRWADDVQESLARREAIPDRELLRWAGACDEFLAEARRRV